MRIKAPPYAVGLIMLAAGLLVLAATALASLHLVGEFHGRGRHITVPAKVTLELDPNETIAILRELNGPHNTVNNPVQDPPTDLSIAVTETATGAEIATAPNSWWMRQSLFGMTRDRREIAEFTAPADGQVTIDVTGSFDSEQVYYVGPTTEMFGRTHGRRLVIILFAAAALGVVGLGLLVWRAASASRIDPDLMDAGPL